jgi:hypothetical protein
VKKIIIYGSTMQRSFNKLQKLLDNMNQDEIKQVKKSSVQTGIFTVELNNGDCYVAVRASDNTRGHRWQYAYIDKNINNDILHNVVLCEFMPEYYITKNEPPENLNEKDYYEWY